MKNRNNGSRIFMTELMFSILFFIIVAAICVQCFATAYAKSRDAKELTNAINIATNAAEDYLAEPDFVGFTDYYDADWNKTESEGEYKATAIVTDSEVVSGCQQMHIVVSDKNDFEIYSIVVEKALK